MWTTTIAFRASLKSLYDGVACGFADCSTDSLMPQAIPAVFAFYKGKMISNFVGCPADGDVETWVANVAKAEETLKEQDYYNQYNV